MRPSSRRVQSSVEDRFAIQDLYARYNAYWDTGDYEAWSRLFTEDGDFRGTIGRKAIAQIGPQRDRDGADSAWENPQHWTNSMIVEGGAPAPRASPTS